MRKRKKVNFLKTYFSFLLLATGVLGVVAWRSGELTIEPWQIFVGMFFALLVWSIQIILPIGVIILVIRAANKKSVNKRVPNRKKDELIINGRVIDSRVHRPDVVDVISNMRKSGRDVHVARGSELDVAYRNKTGQSLSDARCDDCETLEPWDEPKSSGLFSLFRRDSEQDDVEEYYRSRGIDHGEKR